MPGHKSLCPNVYAGAMPVPYVKEFIHWMDIGCFSFHFFHLLQTFMDISHQNLIDELLCYLNKL